MPDHGIRRVNEAVAAMNPTVAELAVLSRRKRERDVEATDLTKSGCRYCQIVRGEEAGLSGIRIVVDIEVVDE